MSANEMRARVRNKKDTSANWTASNPIILDGEIIIVVTAGGETRTKTGDGSTRYTQLPFDDEVVRNLINERVAVSQGVGNAGKVLAVGTDGKVTLVASTETGGAKTWGDLAGINS